MKKKIIIVIVFILVGVLFYFREIKSETVRTTVTVPVNYKVEVNKFDLYVTTNAQKIFINGVQMHL